MDTSLYDAMYFCMRSLFLIAVPLVISVSIAGILAAALQGATSIKDNASLYAVKLVALLITLYILLPSFTDSIVTLARLAFTGF